MRVLENLEPVRVLYHFEEITKIPHGSGNEQGISDYLVSFAKENGIEVIRDEALNVIMKKPATAGYEDQPVVILQGHMDMVAVHTPEKKIDMEKEGLSIYLDGEDIRAEGTSLGGDDGIAVAYALALLESKDIPHPALEVVITTGEEVGMDGARAIDLSSLKGRRLINLDSEDEGIFLAGCAGGARVACYLELPGRKVSGTALKLRIGGLLGGHSGTEIDKGRGNSNVLAGRLLYDLSRVCPGLSLVKLQGGVADNAICRETILGVIVPNEELSAAKDALQKFDRDVRGELQTSDPGVTLEILSEREGEADAYDAGEAGRFLLSLPNGIQSMSADVAGLVQTSLNLGILDLPADGTLHAEFAVRSSVESERDALISKVKAVTELAGGRNEVRGVYPGWKYRAVSPLRDKMVRVFEKMYGKTPKVEAIHAGLECGLLVGKLPDLDCISLGPDMANIHTTEESLNIPSVKRLWEYLLEVLKEKES